MRKNKDLNYWIHFSYPIENGEIIRGSVVCDKYTDLLGKVVTESHDYFNDDIVRSTIIPTKCIDKIILYNKQGNVIDEVKLK